MNKSIKLLTIALSMLLIASTFVVAITNRAYSSPTTVEPKGIDEDVKTAALDLSEQIEPQGETHHSYWNLGDTAIWTGYNGYTGSLFLTYYTLSYIGTKVEIWVQNNINFPSGQTPNRNPPTKPTYAMLQYLADQFEQNILPKESDFFGAPLFLDGSNAQLQYLSPAIPDDPEYYYEPTGRAVILVCNIRDENYYNPSYPYYIIGVHIGAYESYYYDRNIITLDAVSWYHGLGPATMNWGDHLSIVGGVPTIHNHNVTAPYAYDSTVAHEWQHLLHYELCPGDDTFMNEGCSMYAELLCGYGIDPDYPNSYFATPDNSLTIWGDQGDINILADYGAAALWTTYLSDQFGAEFLQYYFSSGGGGIAGINAALAHFHYKATFYDVYRDWKLANLIRADFPGCHRYNYKSINLNDPAYIPVRIYEVDGLPVPWTRGTDFGNTITILGYDTGISMVATYGTDYIAFENWTRTGIGFIYFDGDDTATLPPPHLWTLTPDGWYSGTGEDLANEAIGGTAYVDPADPTLTIVTAYGLETLWDYGFVQVSTDGGQTWVSLENEYTTYDHDPAAHPDIVANLPGLTDYNPDWPDWTTMSFDLSAYAGMTVMIGFRYMTDWATTYEGWWINSATVSGTELTLAPLAPIPPEADFQVTVVDALVIDGMTLYIPHDMWLKDSTETGFAVGYAKKPSYVVLVITPIISKGLADYRFQVTKVPLPWKCLIP
ncbi:MAG: immune inhibitor A [Candidatus Bathyarchaeia archaeon]